jgi:hypothetical protein
VPSAGTITLQIELLSARVLSAPAQLLRAQANLAVLQKISSNWEQGDYVQKGGWATQPGATSSDYHLARACAEKLVQV